MSQATNRATRSTLRGGGFKERNSQPLAEGTSHLKLVTPELYAEAEVFVG